MRRPAGAPGRRLRRAGRCRRAQRLDAIRLARKVRIPYLAPGARDACKLTAKNQLTLPRSITAAVDSAEYFEVEARNGQIVLTPVRIQRGDAVRAKLAELGLQEHDIGDALQWVRQAPAAKTSRSR